MKKGCVYSCNDCLAFEASYRGVFPGSIYADDHPAFCGIGEDIEKRPDGKYGYRPKSGTCKKPKTIPDLVKVKSEYYNQNIQ